MTTKQHLGINIDLSRDELISDQGLQLLKKYYMLAHETSPQEAYARAAVAYCFGDYELAQNIYDYASKNWFMFSSPVLSNAPEIDWSKAPLSYWGEYVVTADSELHQAYGFEVGIRGNNETTEEFDEWFNENVRAKVRGLPISCFLTYVGDTLEELIDHTAELRWLSVKGGGVGGHWSDVRSVSDKAPGPIPFLKTVDSDMQAYRQGKTRKGSYAAYMDVSHPDILEFITLRVPGDPERKCLNLNNAINITDKFLDAVVNNKEWELIDPKDNSVRDKMSARKLWEQILEIRNRTGEPYLNFVDEANRHLPQHLKDAGLTIHGSNLCNEIHLPTSKERTAVCCLSSTNLEKFDEWKDTKMVQELVAFLDNVLEFFILCAPPELRKAANSAEKERSIGLGAMGFHAYLQSKGIPWESVLAKSANIRMFRLIRTEAEKANQKLAENTGACPDAREKWNNIRCSHLLAIAPNANSAIIANTSSSIEPRSSNAVVHKTRAGTHLVKNKYLDEVLKAHMKRLEHDENWLEAQWSSVIAAEGSVQHLPYLTQDEKDVFKTAFEIDQRWVVDHARDRQEFIDQGQSVNLFFPAQPNKAYVNQVHLRAFLQGGTGVPLKGLYYFRTKALRNAEKIGQKVERLELKDGKVEGTECLSCQG